MGGGGTEKKQSAANTVLGPPKTRQMASFHFAPDFWHFSAFQLRFLPTLLSPCLEGLSCTAAGENYWGGKYFDCLAARKNVQAFTIQSAEDFLGTDFSAYEVIRNFCAWLRFLGDSSNECWQRISAGRQINVTTCDNVSPQGRANKWKPFIFRPASSDLRTNEIM